MPSLLDDDMEQVGDLTLTATDFEDGDRMPDYVGMVNENENPELHVSGVPEDAESLVLVLDDPGARGAVGFTVDHWLVWNIDPDTETVPRGWDAAADGATVGYNDMVEAGYAGPSPPDEEHDYHFKLLALDSELELPPEARKAVVEMTIMMEAEVLAATELVGTYAPEQGTAF